MKQRLRRDHLPVAVHLVHQSRFLWITSPDPNSGPRRLSPGPTDDEPQGASFCWAGHEWASREHHCCCRSNQVRNASMFPLAVAESSVDSSTHTKLRKVVFGLTHLELVRADLFALSTTISGQSTTSKRVVRSTVTAEEVFATSEGLESVQWSRLFWTEVHLSRSSLAVVEQQSLTRQALDFTDCVRLT